MGSTPLRAPLRAASAIVATLIATSVSAAPPKGAAWTLDRLLSRLAQHSPSLRADRAQQSAARARQRVAGRLPEPSLGVAAFARPVETRVGPQRARVGLTWPIDWPGRAPRRVAAARAMTAVAGAAVEARRVRLEAALRRPWATRAWQVGVAVLLDQQRALLERLEAPLLSRLRVGKASLADAKRLRLMIEALRERAESLRDAARATEARIVSLADLPIGTPLASPGFEPRRGDPLPALDALLSRLRDLPDVRLAAARVSAAKAAARVAALVDRPGLSVGIDWIMVGAARMNPGDDSGNDALLLRAGVRLPVWRRSAGAERDAALAQVRASEASRDAVLRGLGARVAGLLTALRDARRKRALYGERLAPLATSALEAEVAAYPTGGSRFQSIVELQRQVLQYRVALLTAERARVHATADLEAVLGGPLWSPATGPKPTANKEARP